MKVPRLLLSLVGSIALVASGLAPRLAAQTYTAAAIPSGSPLYGMNPYNLTGLVTTSAGTGSGAVVRNPRIVYSCAHLVFNVDAVDPWLSDAHWYRAWASGSFPTTEGQALRGYLYFLGYASAARTRGNSEDSFGQDFVVHYAYEPTANGTYARYWEDGAAEILSARAKLISGYPSGLYPSGHSSKYLMHQTGPFTRAFVNRQDDYYTVTEVGAGRGNSGGPIWVSDGTDYLFAGVLVSGLARAEGDTTDLSGIYAVDASSTALIDAAITAGAGTTTAPTITVQPTSRRVAAGAAVNFTVEAAGTSLTYQWLFNGNVLPGATSSTLSLPAVSLAHAGSYQIVVRNGGGEVRSFVVSLAVDAPPAITLQPSSRTTSVGQNASFTVGAEGNPTPTYQWQVSTNAGSTWTNITNGSGYTGSSTNTLSVTGATLSMNGYQFRVLVSNSIMTNVASTPAILTVPAVPVVGTISSARQLVRLGQPVALSVSATSPNSSALSYQWKFNGQPIAGATSASLSIRAATALHAGWYQVVVSNSTGSTTSPVVFVNVATNPAQISAWGLNTSGQTAVPAGLSDVVAIAAGDKHNLALKADGSVVAWGSNEYGQLSVPAGLTSVVAVAATNAQSIALRSNGTVASWGSSAFGINSGLASLTNVVAIAAGFAHVLALKADGTVMAFGYNTDGQASVPAGLSDIVAIGAGFVHSLALKSNGTVAAWGNNSYGQATVPSNLAKVVGLAAGFGYSLALKGDGTIAGWGSSTFGVLSGTASLTNVIALVSATSFHGMALKSDGTLVAFGDNAEGQSAIPAGLTGVVALAAGSDYSLAMRSSVPAVISQPQSRTTSAGASATFTTVATENPVFQWQFNGNSIAGGANATFSLDNVQPANAGIYSARVTNSIGTTTSQSAILGINSTAKLVGSGAEFPDIFHPGTGFTYDQILLGGSATAVTADAGEILRMSYVDLNDDIVQVEFSGAGTLSLVLENVSGPANPRNYNQTVDYMRGHAAIILTGANASTNLSIFSVGRANAANQALFRNDVTYDGAADIAFVAISSTDGKFGGLRTANASYFATHGLTGVYAPGVEFTGPVFVGDIAATDDATPVLVIGAGNDVRVTGGDLFQSNGRPVQVVGINQLQFVAGSSSHGPLLSAQANRGRLERNGIDVTQQIVVNPAP